MSEGALKVSLVRELGASRVDVLGVGFDAISMDDLLDILDEQWGRRRLRLAFANPEFVVESLRLPWLKDYLNECDYVLADGVGILWAAGRQRERALPERVTGTDFVPRLCQLAAERRLKLFFFGGRPGVADRAAMLLADAHPGLQVVGTRAGFDFDSAEVVDAVNRSGADVLMVCLGNPLQENWILAHESELHTGLVFGNGGALDFYAGEVVRAPPAVVRVGLEWLWRLGQDPSWSRLRRYRRLFRFVFQVWRTRSGPGGRRI